jgi:FtsH-binding integral membrane protein
MPQNNPYASPSPQTAPYAAINAEQVERLGFIRRTYTHLAGAVLAFAMLEWVLLTVFAEQMPGVVNVMVGGMGWLVVLALFMGVSWLARYWATSDASKPMQYAGLGLYVVAQAAIFLPLLYIADKFAPGAIASAGIITGVIFTGLTIAVFVTRIDFSFLKMFLILGGLAAMAFIICSIVFQQAQWTGILFSCAMVVLAAGYILYDTSNVLHHYRTDQYVAASLALFASVALLFWYVLRIFMAMRR